VVGVQGPLRRRPLERDPFQRARGQAARLRGHDRAGQGARPRAPVDHAERRGLAQLLPPPVKRPGQHRPEQRADLWRGQEVTRASSGAPPDGPHVEAAVRVVEAGLDILRNRDGPPGRDPAGEPLPDRHQQHGSVSPSASARAAARPAHDPETGTSAIRGLIAGEG